MKSKLVPMLGLAVVFGGVSIFVADSLVKSRTAALPAPLAETQALQKSVQLKKIVVAKASLRYGTELSSDVLAEIDWPSDALPEGAFASISDLTANGRRLVLSPMEMNEPILAAKVSGSDGRATLANRLEPGKRAVTIRVDDISGVAGFVTPGDRVDVVLTRQQAPAQTGGNAQEQAAQSAAPGEFASEVILEDIKVLTADQNLDENSTTPGVAKAVTVEVSTEQAQKVALAQQIGTLYLLLRAAGDQKEQTSSALTVADLDGRKRGGGQGSLASIFAQPQNNSKYRTLTVTRGHAPETYSVVEEKAPNQGNQ